ncbi:MAG: T9SS type A sorting domain-containing protein [Bacteroidaceae bacterium]|nr:T9SS type A sorting domain-containing protein [Bacteroidaceae bacterium]
MRNKSRLFIISALCGKLLTVALLFLFNYSAEAQTTLNVWLTSGGVENYEFTESLTLKSTSETELTLTSGNIEVVYPFENIRKLTINDEEAEEIAANIKAQNPMVNEEASVYNAAGVFITKLQTNATGAAQVNLQGLPSGVYIVKSKNTQFKILVK